MKGDSIALSLLELEQFLVQRNRSGERAILIVDEAQGLSPVSLEELRLLSNLQHDGRLLLQVLLVGQDGLLEMIQAPGMEHLHQRLIAASCLNPLIWTRPCPTWSTVCARSGGRAIRRSVRRRYVSYTGTAVVFRAGST